MNLNKFETKLNIDNYTKDDVRELLNYAFKLKEKNENIMEEIARKNKERGWEYVSKWNDRKIRRV